MSYETALWAGAAATILYTFIGGFLAVSWTDTVQASLMIFALILTPVIVIFAVGGLDDSLAVIKQKSIENIDMLKGLNLVAIISLMGWGLGYFGQPHILARFMAADSHHTIVNARRISMTWMILCLAGAVAVGFFGIAYFNEHPDQAAAVNQNGERVFIELAQILFNPWIAGILLSAILAAVMSTLSCQLLVCSSAITEDLYKAFLRKGASQKELVWVGRMMVLVVALVAIALAANPENRVLGLVSYAWAGFGAAFGPVVLFSVMWSRMTRNGALAGMIIGAVTVIVWKQFAWFNLYEIIPGFIFASLGIVVVSLMGKAPSASMQARFEKADEEYHTPIDMLKGLNLVAIISLMGWGLGYFGQPHILARFMAADSHHTIVNARRISMTWMILCLAGAVAVGFFGIAYFNEHPDQAAAVNQNGERVFIELAQILFNPWIAGILLSAILAAVMSTLSCQLLVCSSAITEDLYKAFLRKGASQKELVWVGRMMVLVVALVAIARRVFSFSSIR
ncbi:Proline/sodium symporter PutP (TC 2.A.21.2.1) @ Propionate/sodium symporter [Cronobacter malonaticus 507]|nr:Proline/sodium symporter PutP (TC 2.A.21.2.1) @ Propionate/sodium symporter [Cronobacter malonaticus 507]